MYIHLRYNPIYILHYAYISNTFYYQSNIIIIFTYRHVTPSWTNQKDNQPPVALNALLVLLLNNNMFTNLESLGRSIHNQTKGLNQLILQRHAVKRTLALHRQTDHRDVQMKTIIMMTVTVIALLQRPFPSFYLIWYC